ncbi:MAG: hypothetical protein P9X22_04830 [Candidatus Zapsychrus exili]|nr:hypothetical protein [Candidatus Zapsychrus exili]
MNSNGLQEGLRDIKPPVYLPENHILVIIAIVVFVLIACVIILRYFLNNRGKKQEPEIIKLPWEIALESLKVLIDKNLPSSDMVKEYYFELSLIVRRYIEDRFSLRAPEMTTPEFLEHIKRSNKLEEGHKELLKDFLNMSDMVKFAKYDPTAKEIHSGALLAEKFIKETTTDQRPLTSDN